MNIFIKKFPKENLKTLNINKSETQPFIAIIHPHFPSIHQKITRKIQYFGKLEHSNNC